MQDEKYLKLLSSQYPSSAKAALEIIKLSSILNLPKGTEHFVSDIHGEAASFLHVLKNGSGSIRKKIDDEFGETLSENEKRELATLIYYPEEKLEIEESGKSNFDEWCRTELLRLIRVTRRVASKYSRNTLKDALPRRIRLYHRGTSHGESGSRRQRSVLQRDHSSDHRYRTRKSYHRRLLQAFPKVCRR